VSFVIAAAAEYFYFTAFVVLSPALQQRLAIVFGAIALTAGSFWIGLLAPAQAQNPRAKWGAVMGLGAVQVSAGLTLLLWAAGFARVTLVAAVGIVCFAVLSAAVSLVSKAKSR
jgi:hypothetical protein